MIRYILVLLCMFSVFSETVHALTDIQSSWYRDAVEEAFEKGYIQGYDDGTFRPEAKVSREEFLKILMNTAHIELQEKGNCFTDIDPSMWSERYICSAKTLGITQGYDDHTFRPHATITVIEALALIGRTFGFSIPEDTNREWYEEYREFFDQKGILGGHIFTRNTLLSRGQAMLLLLRTEAYKKGEVLKNSTAGCNLQALSADSGTIEVAGKARKYILSLPSGYTPTKSYPVVFGVHGRTNSNAAVQKYMKLEQYPGGAIVVYPAGLGSGPFSWAESENIQFFDMLLAHVSDNYCIDRDQVFVVGHSLGGYFANKLACLRGDVIRGISVVGGASYTGKCQYPVATQFLHHKDDHLVGISQGYAMKQQFSDLNLCSSNETSKMYGSISGPESVCSYKNPVFFSSDYATYANDPHSWPSSGSRFIFDFFQNLR